jgi:hypothetical protein
MPIPATFSQNEWDILSEKRKDHFRKYLMASRQLLGAQNEAANLNDRLQVLNSDEGSPNQTEAERDALESELSEALNRVDQAEKYMCELGEYASKIESFMNGCELVLPTFK